MSKLKKSTHAILISSLALSVSSIKASDEGATKKKSEIKGKKASSFPASVNKPQVGEIIVKCAGIAKKGKNHCGANGHSCGGEAKTDFDKNEWIYVRPSVCASTPGKVIGKKRVTEG